MVFRKPGWCSDWVVLQTHLCPGVPDSTPFLLGEGGCLLLPVSCLLEDMAGIPLLGQLFPSSLWPGQVQVGSPEPGPRDADLGAKTRLVVLGGKTWALP